MANNAHHSSCLEIDLSAIVANYNILRAQGTQQQTACAVKADAYGTGVNHVAPALVEAGCSLFFVATLEEGIALRPIVPQAEIAILGGFYKGAEQEYKHHKLIPVLNSIDDVARTAAGDRVILHFDTGMNRLGLRAEDMDLDAYKDLNIRCIMSHFACADEKAHPMNGAQYNRFAEIAQHFPNTPKSLANSSGLFRDPKYSFDIGRPGMALYGLNPTPEAANPMQPVVRASARILQIRTAKAGETIGYSATHTCAKETELATITLGYADGVLRALSGKGFVHWQDYKLPICGRVSMDTMSIDLSPIPPEKRPKPHDWLDLIGTYQSADDVAELAGTIGYEILTSLGQRYNRVYK